MSEENTKTIKPSLDDMFPRYHDHTHPHTNFCVF